LIPPSGHIAGIFSRSDSKVGVFKAPANEEVRGALDLSVRRGLRTTIDNRIQDQLNPEGINCLRAFQGRGIRVWGARTLSRDPDWRYVNVRRLVLTLNRWIEMNMAWAAFEPNTPQLWVRIKRELNTYLTELWRAGALFGQAAEQAFFVQCDSETNPPQIREAGQAVTLIGLAPGRPAEFLIIRIVHHTGVEPR
jgi:phage tail sheath protein FI